MRFIIFIAILFAFPLTTTAADNSAPAVDIPGMSVPEAAISATDVKQTAPKELTYFCPMHPHIHGEKGSKCPICGMDLVPVNEQSSPEKKGERKILYWYDPMVPGQKFNKPGKSPYMDMDLVPVYEDSEAQEGAVSQPPFRSPPVIGTFPAL